MDEEKRQRLMKLSERARRILKVVEDAVEAGGMAQQVDYTAELALEQVGRLVRDLKAEAKRETEAKA